MYSGRLNRNSLVMRALPGNLVRIAGLASGSICDRPKFQVSDFSAQSIPSKTRNRAI
jgi:hypothetical protein